MNMDPRELHILEDIEAELAFSDSAFATRMTEGPKLSVGHRLWLGFASAVGVALVLLFAVHFLFAVAGYLILVTAGTSMLRHRRFTPVEESPITTFHRITAGLFRNTGGRVEIVD